MRILRAGTRVASPWKNGGGVTLEVASFPEGSSLDSFGWRISVGEMRQGGSFSEFPGVDCHMAVLEGRLALTIRGRRTTELSPESPVVSFPGDVPCSAQPLSPIITDLHLMVRRGRFISSMERRAINADDTLRTKDSDVTALIALEPLRMRAARHRFELEAHDAVLLGPGEGASSRLDSMPAAKGEYILIKIRASN
jgi:uncharacterized protein